MNKMNFAAPTSNNQHTSSTSEYSKTHMKLVVDVALIELLEENVPYDDLVLHYEYSAEEIKEANHYLSHTAPDDILELLEEAALLREEEQALWEVWAEHCF